MLSPIAKTGVYPVGGEGDRYALLHEGRVVWAGPRDKCLQRWAILAQPQKPPPPEVLQIAIRKLGLQIAIRKLGG